MNSMLKLFRMPNRMLINIDLFFRRQHYLCGQIWLLIVFSLYFFLLMIWICRRFCSSDFSIYVMFWDEYFLIESFMVQKRWEFLRELISFGNPIPKIVPMTWLCFIFFHDSFHHRCHIHKSPHFHFHLHTLVDLKHWWNRLCANLFHISKDLYR